MKRWWIVGLVGLVLAGAFFGIGYAVGDDGYAASDTHGFDHSEMAQMMANGSMQKLLRSHVRMLEQMSTTMTPEMRQRLNRDRMWQWMQSGRLGQMMDQLGEMMQGMPGMGGHGGAGGGHSGSNHGGGMTP